MEIEKLLKQDNNLKNAYYITEALKKVIVEKFREELLQQTGNNDRFPQDNDGGWNIGYKSDEFIDDKHIKVARISYEYKKERVSKLIQILTNEWGWDSECKTLNGRDGEKVFSLSDNSW